jgi:hypothetical protein
MPAVLTTVATVMCSHGGSVALATSQHKLTIDGKPVLVDGDLAGATISGCTQPQSNTTAPCKSTTSMILGAASKLTAGGIGVLLDTANGLTDSLPPGTWSVASAGQAKVTAV